MHKQLIISRIILLAIIAGLCALIWQGMLQVSPNAARLWALLATVALPLVAWAGWWFGHTEARGRLRGLDQGIDKMMGSLSQAAGLRVNTTRALYPRRYYHQPTHVAVLPEVEVIPTVIDNPGVVEL